MNCLVCTDLGRVFESANSSYREARAAPFYRVSTEVAAKAQVDMERARIALTEHHSSCLSLAHQSEFARAAVMGCDLGANERRHI